MVGSCRESSRDNWCGCGSPCAGIRRAQQGKAGGGPGAGPCGPPASAPRMAPALGWLVLHSAACADPAGNERSTLRTAYEHGRDRSARRCGSLRSTPCVLGELATAADATPQCASCADRSAVGRRAVSSLRFSVGSAPPLLDIYVEQATEQRTPSAVMGDPDRVTRLTLAQMLKENRNAVVLAEPGVGKSTAVANVIRRQCSWWREARRSAKAHDAPYGAVVPFALPTDLHGCNSLPAAMATEWKRLTGTDPDERMFGRPPPCAESWLVLIDGMDQILGADARIKVLSRLRDWMSELSSPYRLMITTRPLLGGELGHLGSENVGYFRLRKFDAESLRQFAIQWVNYRKAHHIPGWR